MSPDEMDALVEQVGEEILHRLGWPAAESPETAPASAWPAPEGGYAGALELVCDHPGATAAEVAQACRRASGAGIAVVWAPAWAVAAALAAAGESTRVGALIDYPFGGGSAGARLTDVENALRLGAGLVNLTFGAGRTRGTDPDVLRTEVEAAAQMCRRAGAALAVTLEAAVLSRDELAAAASVALAGAADALCSSTGRCSHAFTSPAAIAILERAAAGRAVVTAGGRIADFGHAAALAAAGADRIAAADPWAILAGAPTG